MAESTSKPTPSTGTSAKAAESKSDEVTPAEAASNPHASLDENFQDDPAQGLDPTKVVGTYAMQPDPNDERPAPLPNVPKGAKKAPADDEPGTKAIGDGSQ